MLEDRVYELNGELTPEGEDLIASAQFNRVFHQNNHQCPVCEVPMYVNNKTGVRVCVKCQTIIAS